MPNPSPQPASRWRTARRWIGYVLGAGLLVACIVMAVRGGDWPALRQAPPALVAGVVMLLLVNVAFTGLVFTGITRPFEQRSRVGPIEMQALVAASTLLNYLPLRPGLIGRATYLKRRHGIAYRSSAIILALVMGMSAIVYAIGLSVAVFADAPNDAMLVLKAYFAAAAPAACIAIVMLMRRASRHVRAGMAENTATAATIRAGEVGFTAIRLLFVFTIIGADISMREALILATCGMFITLVGITPNGLGLREWLYGAIAASGFFNGDVEGGLQLGLTAALVDRAAEAMVIVPTGLISLWYLRRKMRSVAVEAAVDAPHQHEEEDVADPHADRRE